MTPAGPLVRTALAAAVLGVLALAAVVGREVAGPATPPRVLAAPSCPAVLGDALPRTWPSSTYLVPWGPVSGRVCAYPTAARATPETAPVGQVSELDATAVAAVAGLLEDLPDPAAPCTDPSGATSGRTPGTAVVLLRYRPGATPTVGEELRLVVRRAGPCLVVSNGLRTAQVTADSFERLLVLAPPLGTVFPAR